MRSTFLTLLAVLGLGLFLMLGGCAGTTGGQPIPDDDDTVGDDDDSGAGDDDDSNPDDDDDATPDDDDDTSSATCAEDSYEDNDTAAQAATLGSGSHADLRSCPGDDDFYAIEISAGQSIDIDVLFSTSTGDIDARLMDASGDVVASGATTDDDESLVFTTDDGGTFTLIVLLYSETDEALGNDYSLNIALSTAPGDDDDSAPGDDDDTIGDDDDSVPSGSDVDVDGIDDASDNCPTIANTNQQNADGDSQGDACDACPNSATGDTDGDGVCDNLDACSGNDSTGDSDGDGICDDLDICSGNDSTGDSDGDGICTDIDICSGNDSTGDSDGDGICTDIDNCPDDANPGQDDTDGDAVGDICDTITPPSTCSAGATLSCANNSDVRNNSDAGSTNLFDDWSCAAYTLEGPEFIYEFVAADAGTHSVTLQDSTGNLDVVILDGGSSGTCDPNSASACIAYGLGSSSTDTVTTFNATVGVTYFIVVDTFLNGSATYEITITPPDGDGDGIGDSCDTPDACLADSYENNDTNSAAATLTEGSYPGLTSCPGDFDWYAVSLQAGESLQVDATFLDADGDVDIYLYNASIIEVDDSDSGTDNELLGPYTVPSAGTYYIKVELFSDDGWVYGNSYDLDIDITPAACLVDSHEPNDSQGAASAISTGFTGNLTACSGDDDWYSIEVWVGDTVDIDAYFVNSEGDINLRLYDPDQNEVDWDGTGADGANVSHVATQSGTYTIRAYLWSDGGQMNGNAYSLEAVITEGDDDLEPNDSSSSALEIPGYRVDDLRILDGDDDWYAVNLGVGDTIAVNLNFAHSEGDIDLYLYAPGSGGAGANVGDSWTSNDNESISTYTAISAGLHYIKVTLWVDLGIQGGNLYQMEAIVARHSNNWGVDDFFEPNDSQSSAVAIDDTNYWGLTANGANDSQDWYSIYLESGQTFSMDLHFVHNNADLDLELRSSSSALASAVTGTNDESITYTVSSSGTYYIKVFIYPFSSSFSTRTTDYEMDITVN